MAEIQDTFQITAPLYIEATLTVKSEYVSQTKEFSDEFTVLFDYTLGIPKLDANTLFTVAYTTVPTSLDVPVSPVFDPAAPQHTPGVGPTQKQDGELTDVLPGQPEGLADGVTQVQYNGTITAVQPDPP